MAVANTPHFVLLNRWPVVLRENLWRYNQIAGAGVHIAAGEPNNVFVQPERDSIAAALNEAVQRSAPYLGFYPRPVYIEETIPLSTGTKWDYQTLETTYGYVQAFGRRAITLIEANVALAFSDSDGDGVLDTAACTVTTAVAASEVQLFFRVTDGAPAAGHEQWRIEPVTVKDNRDGTLTISGHRALFAHPTAVWSVPYTSTKYFNKEAGDTANAADFVTQVDVYRVYTDSSQAAVLLSDPSDSAVEVEALPSLRSSYEGYFRLWPGATAPVRPRQVRLRYLAGLPLVGGVMEPALETALCRYANVLMPDSPTLSEKGRGMWLEDRKSLGELGLLTERDNLTPGNFGIVLGAHNLWQVIVGWRNERKARKSMEKRA